MAEREIISVSSYKGTNSSQRGRGLMALSPQRPHLLIPLSRVFEFQYDFEGGTKPAVWETWVWSLGWEDPMQEGMATHSNIQAWRIPMDRGAWWATIHGAAKSWTRLSDKVCARACIHTHSEHGRFLSEIWPEASRRRIYVRLLYLVCSLLVSFSVL